MRPGRTSRSPRSRWRKSPPPRSISGSQLAERVLAVGRRLGEVFVAESGPILGELDRRRARLEAWVDVGLELAGAGGWESELLALRFFESTALALPLYAPEDYATWAALGRAAERLGRGRPEIFMSVPAAIHRLPEADRGHVLRLAHAVASQMPAVAIELYFSLPVALADYPDERAAVIASLAPVAARVPAALGDLLPVLRALLAETPAAVRGELIALVRTVAERFPEGAVPFYRVLPRLLEQTGPTGIARWVSEGFAVADANADAGHAYFGLDSRTSRAVLAAGSTAVAFSEVQGLLKRYLQMLTGESHAVAGRADVGYRPPFAVRTGDADEDAAAELLFPVRVDCFPTSEANLRLYRLIAAQHAGRLAFGTLALDPPVAEFLGRFEHRAVAEHLLGIFEGVRIDAAVTRAFRGLAADLRAVAGELAHATLRLPGTVEHLVRVLTQARRADLARRLPAIAERLAAPDATAAESAQATVMVYAEIMRARERPRSHGRRERLSRALSGRGPERRALRPRLGLRSLRHG